MALISTKRPAKQQLSENVMTLSKSNIWTYSQLTFLTWELEKYILKASIQADIGFLGRITKIASKCQLQNTFIYCLTPAGPQFLQVSQAIL